MNQYQTKWSDIDRDRYQPKKRFYRYGQAELEMIDAIQCGLISGVFYLFTQLPEKLKPFFKKQGTKIFKQKIERLQEKGIISLSGDKIKLTKKGKELQKQIGIWKISIKKPRKWDQIWRLVSYDIPERRKNERIWFQRTLKRLYFRKIHESLWVYPFECEEEIAIIAKHFKITSHVILMTTNHLPKEEKIKKYFGLDK